MDKATQERLLDEVLNRPVNGVNHGELTIRAYQALIQNLQRFGSNPGEPQKLALLEVLKAYTDMAQGVSQGRYAFPLPTGAGKTQSIVAWLSTLSQLGIEHVSVAVCASKVEALCDLKRDLLWHGVPEEGIGLLHSYKFNENYADQLPTGYASLPCTGDNGEKQILLVTHNRVRGKGQIEQYQTFQGRPRNLLIWDESLFVADTRTVSEMDIKRAVGWFTPGVTQGSAKEALEYLNHCVVTMDEELKRQREGKGPPNTVKLPPLSPTEIDRYKKAMGENPVVKVLHTLLDFSQAELRIVATPQRGGFITYDIVVPPELKNIVILDASHNIRELVKLDPSIKSNARFSDGVVSYENVTVNQLKDYSGRKAMSKAFTKGKREDRLVSQEIVEVVKQIPPDEAVLIFTFKPRGVDFKAILESDLRGLGIDTQSRIQEGKPRFVWLTWGNETSISKFSYCSNVIFAGVLHRSHVDIASFIVGQQDNLLAEVPSGLISSALTSEIAHSLYQAMSRGSCREVDNGCAKAMNVWLIHKDTKMVKLIRKVMPGVNWKAWQGKYIKANGKIARTADTIQGYLDTIPESETKVSVSKMKKELKLKDTPENTVTKAISKVCESSSLWRLESRSFARVTAECFGF